MKALPLKAKTPVETGAMTLIVFRCRRMAHPARSGGGGEAVAVQLDILNVF
jgi:hypothetical protein